MHGRSVAQYRCRGEEGRRVVIDNVPATLVQCDDGSCEARVCGEVDKRVSEQARALLATLAPGGEAQVVYNEPIPTESEKVSL